MLAWTSTLIIKFGFESLSFVLASRNAWYSVCDGSEPPPARWVPKELRRIEPLSTLNEAGNIAEHGLHVVPPLILIFVPKESYHRYGVPGLQAADIPRHCVTDQIPRLDYGFPVCNALEDMQAKTV
jgi:hypothetical protein